MTNNETKFLKKVRDATLHDLTQRDIAPLWQRHSDLFFAGIADVEIVVRTTQTTWVEFKWVNLPVRPDTLVQLTGRGALEELQRHFLLERIQRGVRGMVVYGSDEGAYVCDTLGLLTLPTAVPKGVFLDLINLRKPYSLGRWIY
jgi:hypothetical protein